MNDTIVQDSISVVEKTINSIAQKDGLSNIWMWVAIGEFAIIIGLLIKRKYSRKERSKNHLKRESIKQKVDFNNIINSSFHSEELYNVLKVKCHPDRFATNAELNEIAEKLYQEITKNKTNLKRLEELKTEAKRKLNIKF